MGDSTKKSKSSKKGSSNQRYYEDENGFLIRTPAERKRIENEIKKRQDNSYKELMANLKAKKISPEDFVKNVIASKGHSTRLANDVDNKGSDTVKKLKKSIPDQNLRHGLYDHLADFIKTPLGFRFIFIERFGFFPSMDANSRSKASKSNTEVDLNAGSYKEIYKALIDLPKSELSRLKNNNNDPRSTQVQYTPVDKKHADGKKGVSVKEVNGKLSVSVTGVKGGREKVKDDDLRGAYDRKGVDLISKNFREEFFQEMSESQAAKWALSPDYWDVSGWQQHKKSDMMSIFAQEFGGEFGGSGRAGEALPHQATHRVADNEEDINKPIHVWVSDVANSLDEKTQNYVFNNNIKKNRHDYIMKAVETNWMISVYNAGSKYKHKEPNSKKNFFRQEKNRSVWYTNDRANAIGDFTNPITEFQAAYVYYCNDDKRLSAKAKEWFKKNLGERGKM